MRVSRSSTSFASFYLSYALMLFFGSCKLKKKTKNAGSRGLCFTDAVAVEILIYLQYLMNMMDRKLCTLSVFLAAKAIQTVSELGADPDDEQNP